MRGRLDEIAAPTLVIHGTADPLFPFGHAEALARGIPGAELLPLAGVRHQVPPRTWWEAVITAMLRLTRPYQRSPKPQLSIFSASCAPAFTPVAGLPRTTPISVRPFLTASNSRQCLATSV